MQHQEFAAGRSYLEREIRRKPGAISTELLIEARRRNAVKRGKIRVDQHAVTAKLTNMLGDVDFLGGCHARIVQRQDQVAALDIWPVEPE